MIIEPVFAYPYHILLLAWLNPEGNQEAVISFY
jgi:hypothetical protein